MWMWSHRAQGVWECPPHQGWGSQCPPGAVSGYHEYEDNSQDSDLDKSHRNGKKILKPTKESAKIKSFLKLWGRVGGFPRDK